MSRDPDRPDPDALLASIQHEEKGAGRGRLKIFFGFSPGVGKTYAMLEAARRLRAGGVDVVAGVVETHGREETARLLEGIEVLPRLEVAHRGHVLHEFDLDGAIARRPAILLVDELAHTNAPGLRHTKRWQDVFEVLASGIDVHTTLNVQHVEGVVDLVEEATGIRVRETVPDTVLDRADEIELIDLPPDALLERLRSGKIYLPDVARRAVDRFFRRSNLLHLRELALVRMAQHAGREADASRRMSGATSRVAERIVVGAGPGPGSTRAIRDAARIAAGLRAPWTAVTVRPPAGGAESPSAAASLESNLALAESLGGGVSRVAGPTVADALVAEATRLGATRMVVGRPRKRGWWDVSGWRGPGGGSTLDRLVRSSGPIDVVIAGAPDDATAVAPARQAPRPGTAGWPRWAPLVTGVVAAVLAIGTLLRPYADDHDMSLVSLLVVVGATLRFGRAAGILAASLSALGINYLFLEPRFRLTVSDSKEVVTLLILLLSGILIAELLVRVRAQREAALAAERRLSRLLELSGRLAAARDDEEAAAALAATIAEVTGAEVEVVLATPAGPLRSAPRAGPLAGDAADAGVAAWCHEFGEPAGRGMATLPGARVSCLPIRAEGRGLGVVVIAATPPRDLTRDELDVVQGAVRQTAVRLLAIDRTASRTSLPSDDPP